MIKYVFRDQPVRLKNAGKASPQKIGEAIARIKAATKGRSNSKTIEAAIREKKYKSEYLRQFLEWDDKICGRKWRQEQVRELISCIDIVDAENSNRQMPAFVSIIADGGRSYYGINEVLDSSELTAIALAQAERDFEAYEKRFLRFGDICSAIRRARETIAEHRRRTTTPREDRPRPQA